VDLGMPIDLTGTNGTDLSKPARAAEPNRLTLCDLLALLRRVAMFADARLGGRPRLGK
jgi:hypothetical protein